ncbi:pectate lyase [uncultured Mediterranean phage uvDeep-CGR2-KM19-C37]|nr:pectate lyase [uncultured Mediterranean phage uvDeep-CGR2-KM19-C37]
MSDIYTVTSLADSGAGTLREAIDSANGPRTVEFSVGGIIRLQSKLTFDQSGMTVDGETAPGIGITIADYETRVMSAANVALRHMRFRLGDRVGGGQDALQLVESRDVIVDQCSISWGIDECLGIFDCRRVTVQNCIISEGLHKSSHPKGVHSMGLIHQGGELSLRGNLLAHHNMRSPFSKPRLSRPCQLDMVNNVIYDWGVLATDLGTNPPGPNPQGGELHANWTNNFYRPGPSSATANREFRGRTDAKLWDSGGNVIDGHVFVAPWGGHQTVSEPFSFGSTDVNSATAAYADVLRSAGASHYRDDIDQRIVNQVSARSGRVIDSQTQVGGWP